MERFLKTWKVGLKKGTRTETFLNANFESQIEQNFLQNLKERQNEK